MKSTPSMPMAISTCTTRTASFGKPRRYDRHQVIGCPLRPRGNCQSNARDGAALDNGVPRRRASSVHRSPVPQAEDTACSPHGENPSSTAHAGSVSFPARRFQTRVMTAEHVRGETASAALHGKQFVTIIPFGDDDGRSTTATGPAGGHRLWLQPPRLEVPAQERERVLASVCTSPGRLPARWRAIAVAAAAARKKCRQ